MGHKSDGGSTNVDVEWLKKAWPGLEVRTAEELERSLFQLAGDSALYKRVVHMEQEFLLSDGGSVERHMGYLASHLGS